MTHDYSKFTDAPKDDTGDSLARLAEMADEQVRRQNTLATAEAEVKSAKEELRQISEEAIPELMESLGVETFTTTSGVKITIKEIIRASILKPKQHQAFAWLRKNGHEALIKRVVKLQFGMGEDELANETVKKLEDLDLEDNSSVHAATLKKFVKELLEEGKDVPEDLFSVHKQRVSSVKI